MPCLKNKNDKENATCLLDFDSKGRLKLGIQLRNQHLTPREIDILKCLLQGYSAKQAARELEISRRTVEAYIHSLKLKLHCNRRSDLIRFCIKIGLFSLLN